MKKILILLALIIMMGNASGAWYDTNYIYYKQVTINQLLVNDSIGVGQFPLLVSVTDTDLRDHCQSDGDDIIFVNSANTSQLDHEVELWNSTTGELVAWVNITDITNVSFKYCLDMEYLK